MMTCAVCGKPIPLPIEIRLWDEELDDEIEASVCSGDCAKAWIDGSTGDNDAASGGGDGAPVVPDFAEGDEQPHPGWGRTVEGDDGQQITYTAHAATDPKTVAALDALAKAAYTQFMDTHAAESEAQR